MPTGTAEMTDLFLTKTFMPELNTYVYRFCCRYEDRHLPKNAGFHWDKNHKWWYTPYASVAAQLLAYADTPQLRQELMPFAGPQEKTFLMSSATDADIQIPLPPGRSLMPYQKAGVAFALEHPRTLLADEMGLGKTVQVIALLNLLFPSAVHLQGRHILIVCPASLKWNWKREFSRWSIVPDIEKYIAIPDLAKLRRQGKESFLEISQLFDTYPVVIVNYDILHRFVPLIQGIPFDVLVADECHYLKNPNTIRSRSLLGGRFDAKRAETLFPLYPEAPPSYRFSRGRYVELPPVFAQRCLFLSGTPLTNRPVELFPTLHYLRPDVFRDYRHYTMRYCNAHYTRYGYDVRGASNLTELHALLRQNVMVRRQKAEVLPQLPEKRYWVFEIALEQVPKAQSLLHQEKMLTMTALEGYRKHQHGAYMSALAELARVRHQVALLKVPVLLDWLEDVLENEQKIVIFGHHKDVLHLLQERLVHKHGEETVVLVTGDTSAIQRQQYVERFQQDEQTRIFLGSVLASGVGFTLTQASQVLFAEMDWVPANLTQAEDRCHRIGQDKPVQITYAVVQNSVECTMAQRLAEKSGTIHHVLEGVASSPTGTALSPSAPEAYWAAQWLALHEKTLSLV